MRARRRAPGVRLDGDLSGRTYAPDQCTSRARCRGAPLAEQLSGTEGDDRGDLRTQSRPAAAGANRIESTEQAMIAMRRRQLSFADGLIAEEVSDLRDSWMEHADALLADEAILSATYEALSKRHPKSRSRGRHGTPAEVVLRLLILKHIRNWSYEVLEREVRANLVYRDFTRVGGGKMPDAKTMGRWGVALGPEVLKQVHERLVRIARDKGVTAGRRMRGIRRWWRQTSIIRPTQPCWAMGFAC